MDFRRGNRDERRRRVLMDEVEPATEAAGRGERAAEAAAAEPTRRYTDAVLSQSHSQLFDLIPTRGWTIFVVLGLLLSAIAGIEALYGVLALSNSHRAFSSLTAIDLSQRGSVATWLSSAMLMACAAYGLLTYHIRRHRADDYRGRYRMWCWVVPVFVLASVDQVAGLQQTVRLATLELAGIPDYPDSLLIWFGAAMLLTVAFGGRLVVEMRSCRAAGFMIVQAVAALGVVSSIQIGWILSEASVLRSMALSSLAMAAQLGLLMAVLLNLRAVHREAVGRTPMGRPKRKRRAPRRASAKSSDSDEKQTESVAGKSRARRKAGKISRVDPAHEVTSPEKTQKPAAASSGTGQAAGGDGSVGKAKRRVAAQASVEAPSRKSKKQPSSSRQSGQPQSGQPQTGQPQTGQAAQGLCEPDDDQVDPSQRRLSKAERKKLRKQRRRQQQA